MHLNSQQWGVGGRQLSLGLKGHSASPKWWVHIPVRDRVSEKKVDGSRGVTPEGGLWLLPHACAHICTHTPHDTYTSTQQQGCLYIPRMRHRVAPSSTEGHWELRADFLITVFVVAVLGIKPRASLWLGRALPEYHSSSQSTTRLGLFSPFNCHADPYTVGLDLLRKLPENWRHVLPEARTRNFPKQRYRIPATSQIKNRSTRRQSFKQAWNIKWQWGSDLATIVLSLSGH